MNSTTKILHVWTVTGKIDKNKSGSFVHIQSYSDVLDTCIDTSIIFMGKQFDILENLEIGGDILASNESDIVVTDEMGDFFKVSTTLDAFPHPPPLDRKVKFKITNKNAMDYWKYNIPATAYITFVGAAIALC